MMDSVNIRYNDRYCSQIFISTFLTRGHDLRVKIMDRVFMIKVFDESIAKPYDGFNSYLYNVRYWSKHFISIPMILMSKT